MPTPTHFRRTDLRALARLTVDGTLGVVGIVEHLHHNILRVAPPLGQASDRPTRGITGLVYRTIRGVTQATGGGLDLLLRSVEAQPREDPSVVAAPSDQRQAVVAALNGVLGDHLASSGNALAIPTTLLHGGQPLPLGREPLATALPGAKARVLLLVHGLCMHPGQWARGGEDPGLRWAQASGANLLHLHYNTGRPVAQNGRDLADLLERLAAAWPVPLDEIAIVGHSMGGLVARSACHQAGARGHRWRSKLKQMVFLGTPHHGSPLERGGRIVDVVLAASPYTAAFARIGRLRSAGITDLRHGRIVEGDAAGSLPVHVPLPEDVACHAVAGVLPPAGQPVRQRVLGDGLVPVDSALGRHADPGRSLAFAPDRQWTANGIGHLGLLDDAAVRDRVEGWLDRRAAGPRA
jgi:pimeloyl-ACP methyl ester carboxylesterase